METIDFPRSFLTFRTDWDKKPSTTASHKPPYTLNNARIPLDCVCTIVEKDGPYREQFVLGTNCKTERVGVEGDIWTQPNADFVPLFAAERFMNLKAFDQVGERVPLYPPSLGGQPERQIGRIDEAYDSVRIDVVRTKGEVLESSAQIVEAVLANELLVAHTQIENERYRAVLEYPVKTINANERDAVYQTDTGPMLLPDLSVAPEDLLGGMELAFSAFNCPEWIEFIARVPTPINDEISVHHYSKSVRCDAHNQIVRLQ